MKLIVATICCFLIVTCAEGNPGRRILNGYTAAAGQFPYQVSIQINNPEDYEEWHFCGGSILNPTTILTACRCVYNKTAEALRIVAGSNNKYTWRKSYMVKNIKCYNESEDCSESSDSCQNDVALLKLETPIRYSKNVAPVKLPTSKIADNKKLTFSGWGITYKGDLQDFNNVENPDYLQYMEYKNINLKKCMKQMKEYNVNRLITESNICGIPVDPEDQGFCKGDSGGPLVCDDGEQYGIASWGVGECGGGQPDVFTSVYCYVSWIKKEMFNSSNSHYYKTTRKPNSTPAPPPAAG